MRAAALLLALPVMCAAQDSWTGPDKPKHFAVSFVLGAAIQAHAPHWSDSAKFAAAMAPGLGKELTDDKFSTKDLVWDAIGAYAGIKVTGWVLRRNFIGYRSEF